MTDRPHPDPATHGRTIRVGEHELAPGATLSRESRGPIGASEYTTFLVLDVHPDAGELDLYRMTDRARRTVTADGLVDDLGVNTFVMDDGREADEGDANASESER